ncbi:hypothetical protein HO173_008522 [Letharia columbiana]|uniref:Uncharacterized protein n=1 Tax=Letharia columbiana TaxID=112416 RepID=A0A8H6L2N6_9LECA|nr:uncharacterized protein HO173_008522 [Letharia columbiana]KAF6233233.1 hypothetical protein HO173_008522 [Letharia columbiana]
MEMSSMVSRIESAEEGDEDGRLRVSFWEKDFDLRPFVSPGPGTSGFSYADEQRLIAVSSSNPSPIIRHKIK